MIKIAMAMGLLLASTGTAGVEMVQASGPDQAALTSRESLGSDWVVKAADHICGVSAARQISNPAKVSYETLMDATPEMKEMKRRGIDKDSARGQTLVSAASDRIQTAANTVMGEKGHCSVWKTISHKKGQTVTDITEAVKAKLGS